MRVMGLRRVKVSMLKVGDTSSIRETRRSREARRVFLARFRKSMGQGIATSNPHYLSQHRAWHDRRQRTDLGTWGIFEGRFIH